MARIDLKELAERESERVEWKEHVADIDDVLRTIAAFSNDFANLGGGYVVCGAKEIRDEHGFPRVEPLGLTADRLKEVEGRVMTGSRDRIDPPVVPGVEELPGADGGRRVLVFIVPATPHAHVFRGRAGEPSYPVRASRSTIEARNGVLRELLVRKRALDPWDRRAHPSATLEDVDLVLFRESLQRMGLWDSRRALEDYFEPDRPLAALAPAFATREPLTGTLRLRNFALLLFARDVQRFFPGAFAILSVYAGTDRSERSAERHDLGGSIIEQARKLIDRLDTEAYLAFDKENATPNLLKYPRRALQEAVVNALVHRDYESDQPARITVFADRVEIRSPGSLPTAVEKQRFVEGRASPVWRNQALAYFFVKLQLAQSEGQGIPTILRTMTEEGCPPPVFDVEPESVTCILPAHPRHAELRELKRIENELVLGNVERAEAAARALLEKDPFHQRALELYAEIARSLRRPELLWELWKQHHLEVGRLGPLTKLILAETLATVVSPSDEILTLTRALLEDASRGRQEEADARRVAVSLRKLGDDEGALAYLDRLFAEVPAFERSAGLLQIRGKAKIGLAKRCTETARNRNFPSQRRARAWERAREYLVDAERDLSAALEGTTSVVERSYIEDDLQFAAHLRERTKKPRR